MHGYIQDCTAIGTAFVTSIANMLTTAAIDVKINLGNSIKQLMSSKMIGNFKYDKIENTVEIGSLRYG
jgi:hypothetical protein